MQGLDSASDLNFLQGGGELGRRMREFDWESTPLGAPQEWPQSLKTAVRITLTCRQPMFVWWGPDLINLYNDAYRQVMGGKHPGGLGRPAREVWSEIWDQVGPRAQSAIRGDEGTYDESLLLIMERHGYREETYYTFSYSPVPDDDGSVGGIICANTDETQRILSERRMALLRELAAGATNAATLSEAAERSIALSCNGYDLLFSLLYLPDREEGRLRLVASSGFDAPHPVAPEEVAWGQQTPWPASEEFTLAALPKDLRRDLPTGGWSEPPVHVAVAHIAVSGLGEAGGLFVAGLNPFRPFDDAFRGFLELVTGQVASNLSNAHAYEEERKRAEALAELDRAKTAFFSNVSHEFRTPITLMLGPLEDMLETGDGHLASGQREQLTVVHRNGQRLLKLVNTLLDFSRIEAGRIRAVYEPTDLAAYTRDLASVFQSAFDKAGVELQIDCPDLDAPAWVDRDMWEKIVLNLVSNAFKFTLEGEVRVSLSQADGAVLLQVNDTGLGIPDDEMPKLFKRFHRVEGAGGRTHEGTGIGLALVQDLVRLHGGEVHAESEYGRGSRFSVRIPLGSDHLPADQLQAPRQQPSQALASGAFVEEALRWLPAEGADSGRRTESQASRARAGRLLIADDNADMRDYVRRLLEDQYEVTAVADGQEALEAALADPPDLLLTDVMMPRLDGVGLLRQIRAHANTASIPVIMLSARAGEEARIDGLAAGADDYLTKPFSARELLARVAGTLELSRVRRSAMRREEELRAQTHRLLESISEGFAAFDSDFRFTYLNAEGERMLGRSRDDLIGRPLWETYSQLKGTDIERHLRRSLQEAARLEFEHVFHPTDRQFSFAVDPAEAGGITVRFRETTEQQQAVRALRESERRFRELAMNAPVAIFTKDLQGRYTLINRRGAEILGRSEHDVLGRTDRELMRPEEARIVQEWDRRVIAERQKLESEVSVTCADGTLRDFISVKFPLHDAQGVVIGICGVSVDITDRKRAEQAMRDSEARFRWLADNAPVLIWTAGPDKLCNWVNKPWLDFVGRPLDAELGDGWVENVHPDDLLERIRVYNEAFEARRPFTADYRLRRRDGEYRWVVDNGMPLHDLNGEFAGYIGSCIDITDRKTVEAQLSESEARFRHMADNAPVMIWVTEADGACSFLSESWYEFTGQTPSQGLGYGWMNRVHPDDYPGVYETFVTANQDRMSFRVEYQLLRRDGVYRWMIDAAAPRHDEEGRFLGYIGSVIDITDRKLAEEQLRDAKRVAETLNRVGCTLAAQLDLKSVVQFVTDQCVQLIHAEFGAFFYNNVDETGESYTLFTLSGMAQEQFNQFPMPRNTDVFGPTFRGEKPVRLDDVTQDPRFGKNPPYSGFPEGHPPVRSYLAVPVMSPSGSVLGGLFLGHGKPAQFSAEDENVIVGIAAQAAVAIDNARLYDAAQRASQAKSDFLANMSHEIRTPMTAILGYAEILQGHLTDADDLQSVETIRRNGQHLLEIINDILDLSRIEAGRLEVERQRFRPDDLVQSVCELIEGRAREKRLTLTVEYVDAFPEVIESDPTRLRQILLNLVGNAVKFTSRGGVSIEVRYLRPERKLAFDVSDTGIGIAPEHLARLFLPFSQGDTSVTRQYGGSGLGLAICKRLAAMLGGDVTVSSEVGTGSRFRVTIDPGSLDGVTWIRMTEARERAPVEEPQPLPQLACRVLVVDDRREVRYLAQHFVEVAGGAVSAVEHGEDALEAVTQAAEEGRPFDLVLMDMQMPVMDGYAATRELRRRGFSGKVIALTAHAMHGDKEKCLAAGCDDYVTKPLNHRRLIETIDRCLSSPS